MAKPAPKLEGFVQGRTSDGNVTCTGCWDASDHDVNAKTTIDAGRPVYCRQVNSEYGEWDDYCASCARAYLEWIALEVRLVGEMIAAEAPQRNR